MYEIKINNSVIHENDVQSYKRVRSGTLCEGINQIPKLEFAFTPSNPAYSNEINDRKDIVVMTNLMTGDVEFEGTILSHSDTMSSSGELVRSVVCEGYVAYLCDSIQPYYHYNDYSVAEFITALLDHHNSISDPSKHIYMGSCDFPATERNSKTTAYRNTLDEIKVNLIDRIGGEFRIRRSGGKLYFDFMQKLGTKSNTQIALAKNMKALEVSSDSTNTITRLIPLGYQPEPDISARRLDISSVNGGKIYIDDENAKAKYGIICGTAEFDDITLPANLKTAGQKYLENNNRVRKSYRSEILDLSLLYKSEGSISCGNTYRFINSFMGLDEDLRLIKRNVDIFKPYSPTVEIGDKAERITDVAVKQAKLIEYELPKQKLDILKSAKSTASSLINSGINGYVVVNPNEILIMDTPDKATATKVWRWNSGGFGYSSTGYDGEYGTAITMDGAIVADFITAGVLRGLEIINGDGTFYVAPNGSVTASAINITGGSINIETASETYDVIELSCREWTAQISPAQLLLKNDSINAKILIQAGAMFFYTNDENRLTLSSDGNIIAKGGIYAEDFYIKKSDDTIISVKNAIGG